MYILNHAVIQSVTITISNCGRNTSLCTDLNRKNHSDLGLCTGYRNTGFNKKHFINRPSRKGNNECEWEKAEKIHNTESIMLDMLIIFKFIIQNAITIFIT